MNKLSTLINQSIKNNNLRKSDFIQQMGYGKINKGIRRLEQLFTTLDDKNNLLPKIETVLKIEKIDLQRAYSEALIAFVNTKNANFKPRVELKFKQHITIVSKWRVSRDLEQPNFNSGESLEDELKKVCKLYQLHQNKFAIFTQGFIYYRTYTESYYYDEKCNLLKVRVFEPSTVLIKWK